MRDVIALLLLWSGEPTRHRTRALAHRAITFLFPPPLPPAPPVIPPAPPYARRPPPDHVRRRAQPLNGEEIALVRPYLIDHERRTGSRPGRPQPRELCAAVA
ncbi:hypothetical protein [Streptomyces benahoarensis]|uniref:Uncharacterized protein n=1 Tax=Streptomyces benahoarensis TaxID=2595054 RepID=A0A553YUV9_9ACTN|nr:hypothetical protein [Streptomyces benahoarensis]TSB20231.1 hypothetical protein FNJ62_21210 [Streptomyces benahoarensis]TSB32995.1 hypothetical protein FNZ23_24390 [Streptomyces benahoarensis]